MREPLTYGTLAGNAARIAAEAAASPPRPSARLGDILDHAAGIGRLFATAGRHARLLNTPIGGQGRSTPFVNRLVTTTLIADQLYAHPTPGRTPWHRAADTLGAAHDLLASHTDRHGTHQSLDAVILGDPVAIRGAMTRLTDITLAAALGARAIPPLLAPFQTNAPSVIPAAQILTRLGALASPIRMSREHLDRTGDHALDPIGPLLGDPAAPPLERNIHQLRRLLHQLSQPDTLISHEALVALSDLAIGISERTHTLTRRAAHHTRGPDRAHLDRAGEQAAQTARTWHTLQAALDQTTSRGIDGGQIPELVPTIERSLARTTRLGRTPTRRDINHALDVMRRAALLLPEIAERSGLAAQNLATHRALLNPAATLGGGEPISDHEQTWITGAYRAATLDGATTISRLVRLPGTYPQPERAQYLVQRYTPEAAEELPGLRGTDPTTDTAAAGPDRRTPMLTDVTGGILQLDDPHHGTLRVDGTALSAAATQTPHTLRSILANHPWIDLDGTETLITLAALTTIYAPDSIKIAAAGEPGPSSHPETPVPSHQPPDATAGPSAPPVAEPPDLLP